MAESVKPRFAVDLDEIERQLASSPATSVPAASRNDPLAELARIVGQDDPFQSILASERRPSSMRREPGNVEDLFVVREDRERRQPAPSAHPTYEPAPPTDLDAAYAEQVRQYEEYQAQTGQDGYEQGGYEQDRYPDPASYEDQEQAPERTYPQRSSRKALLAVGAVVGAAVLGVGGALWARGPSAMLPAGDPPLITAAKEPSKVQPQSPGGVEFPNQNKQIYERAGQEAQTKVVNREEQPVDVRQATRTASADAPGATSAIPSTSPLALGEPRKVKTISIRPDGTVILPDSKPAAAAPAPTQTAAATAPSTPAARSPQAAVPAAAETPQSRPAATTPTAPAPRPAAATPASSGGASPQAANAPAQPAPQRVASAVPTAPLAEAAAPEAPISGFSVQLGVSTSENDAKSTLQRFQQKYAALEGKPPLIRKAEVNGSTVFRVRVGPMAREEASSLCSKIQGQGGQCFVAKN